MPDGGMKVDTQWLRMVAGDCDGTASAVRGQLGPADNAANTLKQAAPGWSFLGSLDDLNDRFEKLNELLRQELDHAAEEFRYSASDYDGRENFFERQFHKISGGGWGSVLDYD